MLLAVTKMLLGLITDREDSRESIVRLTSAKSSARGISLHLQCRMRPLSISWVAVGLTTKLPGGSKGRGGGGETVKDYCDPKGT